MDQWKKKDALKQMSEMADTKAIRKIKEYLIRNDKGEIKGTVQNYMIAFRDDPLIKECLRYNRLSERVDITRKLWWNEDWDILSDNVVDQFYLYFEVYYGLGNEKNLNKALQIEAASRAYHPTRCHERPYIQNSTATLPSFQVIRVHYSYNAEHQTD